MDTTTIKLDPDFVIDEVSPLIFGGFIEHIGRCVYEGIYDPASSHADSDGLREDVLEALAALKMTIMRYPGGNFVSGYHWKNGIGPKEDRPRVRELAWQSIETNHFGTDEFIKLCKKMQWEPILAVNLGTGTPEEARDWVEYCNVETGTQYADMRAGNASEQPYGVRYWCLGNEMDGPWQLGHVPADQYAIRAQQAAKMMKDCDPAVQMVACGSSAEQMPEFGAWDREVLEHIGGLAQYISLHRYAGNMHNNPANYLATGVGVDRQIEAIDATCRYVQAVRKSPRRPYLCFDEWNVWYKARSADDMNGKGTFAPHLVEEIYNMEDALVVAQFLNSFIRHADTVKIANLAQVVNVIAPIMTRGDDLLIQGTYHVFKLFSECKEGKSLRLNQTGSVYDSEYGVTPFLDSSAILNDHTLALFLVNRSPAETLPVVVDMPDLAAENLLDGVIIHHHDLKVANSFDDQNQIVPKDFSDVDITGTGLSFELPAASFLRLRVKVAL